MTVSPINRVERLVATRTLDPVSGDIGSTAFGLRSRPAPNNNEIHIENQDDSDFRVEGGEESDEQVEPDDVRLDFG